jgi:hypothetical protein
MRDLEVAKNRLPISIWGVPIRKWAGRVKYSHMGSPRFRIEFVSIWGSTYIFISLLNVPSLVTEKSRTPPPHAAAARRRLFLCRTLPLPAAAPRRRHRRRRRRTQPPLAVLRRRRRRTPSPMKTVRPPRLRHHHGRRRSWPIPPPLTLR